MTMISKDLLERVHKKAISLFKYGIAQSPLVQDSGKTEKPIPIYGPDHEIVSWFVGITVKDRLAGFMQFNADLRLLRYSTFQRHASTLKDCPKKETWLDPTYIAERARTKASPEDELSPPFLTYDHHLSRIVWAVEAKDRRGQSKRILVAGDFVYLADQSETPEDFTL
jgi:hypothetical protein